MWRLFGVGADFDGSFRFRALRQRHGISLAECAARLGLRPKDAERYDAGHGYLVKDDERAEPEAVFFTIAPEFVSSKEKAEAVALHEDESISKYL